MKKLASGLVCLAAAFAAANVFAAGELPYGYTEVEYIHLIGISGATDTELNDIERLLKEGVII